MTWLWSAYSIINVTASESTKAGVKTWYTLGVDNVGGRTWDDMMKRIVGEAGGRVISAFHPLGETDYSAYLVQAQSSGADALLITNAGTTLISERSRGWLCPRILGSSAFPVLVRLVLGGWIGETPGLTSMVLNVATCLLSFVPRALEVIRVLPTTDQVTIEASPRSRTAECPSCGLMSRRIHSVYRRVLDDLPWQGRPVTIRVAARRFRCPNRACSRQTFAERLTGVMALSSRRTGRLSDLQRHLALALGGQAGARLAARLAIPTSPDTLLRLALAGSLGEKARPTPRVLGIDDWAWRRGHRYGTVMVDLETNNVVDLLPDREAATVAAWLRGRPGVEIVARDRAGAYADGVRQGAPAAVQVADRWHLLRNLGDAVRGLADKHSAAAGRAAQQVRAHLQAVATTTPSPASTMIPSTPTTAERASMDSRARRQSRYEEAARLRAAGASIKGIATELGSERKTVRRWLRLGHAPLWNQPAGGSMLDAFVDVLTRRWSEGCRNATQLWRELVALGFRGRPSTVRHWVGKHRRTAEQDAPAAAALPPIWPVPRGYYLARLLMSEAPTLKAEDALFRTRLLDDEPALGTAVTWAQRLHALLRRKVTGNLDEILTAAKDTLLARFAAGLRRDFAAISAALELPWTTSPVEGQISRLKMLKRTIYGRAGFDLLRARVLHAA